MTWAVIRSSQMPTAEARIHELQLRAVRYVGGAPVEPSSLSSLSEDELTRLVDGLDRTARPCGCREGAVGVSLAFIMWPVWIALRRRPATVFGGVARALELIPVTAVSALGFKGAGIMWGRVRHQRLRAVLAASLRDDESGRATDESADPSPGSTRIPT
jgi:hypothetical protein